MPDYWSDDLCSTGSDNDEDDSMSMDQPAKPSLLSETAAAHIREVERLGAEREALHTQVEELRFKLHEREALIAHQRAALDDLSRRHAFWNNYGIRMLTSLTNVQAVLQECIVASREAGHDAASKIADDDPILAELAKRFAPQQETSHATPNDHSDAERGQETLHPLQRRDADGDTR